MGNKTEGFLISMLTIVAVVVAACALGGVGYGLYSVLAPRYAAVDAKTFHESAQYNEGMVRDLETLQLQWAQASETERASLRAVALHRFSVYPEDRLTPNLRAFYEQLKGN